MTSKRITNYIDETYLNISVAKMPGVLAGDETEPFIRLNFYFSTKTRLILIKIPVPMRRETFLHH